MNVEPIKYATGDQVLVGDSVLLEGGISGTVTRILRDESWMHEEDDPIGVYIQTLELGLMRYSPADPDMVLVERGNLTDTS